MHEHLIADNFASIHRDLMVKAMTSPGGVLRNYSFRLTNPENNLGINGNVNYYEKFFEWLLSGSDTLADFVNLSEKAKKYHLDYEGRNVAYGPRIIAQMEDIIGKLKDDENTRQAFLGILVPEDHIISKHVNTSEEIVEYPCTIGWNYHIEDGQLCCTTVMRSNNVCSVVGLDVYLGTSLQKYIAGELGIELGYYSHVMLNGHVLDFELERAEQYVRDFENSNT